MRTLVKVMLFVGWLLGAGSGLTIHHDEPAGDPAVHVYAVMDGVDLSVHGPRIVLHVEGGGASPRLSLSTVAPYWVHAVSRHVERRTMTAADAAAPHDGS